MQNTTWPIELGSSGVLSPGRWLWLRSIVWATVLSAGAIGFFFASQYLGGWLHLPPNSAYVIVLGIPVLAFVAYAMVVRVAERRVAIEVIPSVGMFSELLVGAALGFCMLCAMTALLWSLGLYHVRPNHLRHAFDSFVFDSYLSGMLEELLFRAILLRILGRAFGVRWGLVLSAVFFGAAHLGHCSWLAAVEIAINGGLVLGLSYMATGRLWMSVGLHTAWDFTEDSFLGVNSHNGFLISTPAADKSDVLTGGAFGPDGSVLAAIVGVLVIVAIAYAWKGYFLRKSRSS